VISASVYGEMIHLANVGKNEENSPCQLEGSCSIQLSYGRIWL